LSGSGALTINNTGSTTTGVRFRGSAASTYSGALTVTGGSIGTQGNVFAFDNSDVTTARAVSYLVLVMDYVVRMFGNSPRLIV